MIARGAPPEKTTSVEASFTQGLAITHRCAREGAIPATSVPGEPMRQGPLDVGISSLGEPFGRPPLLRLGFWARFGFFELFIGPGRS